MKYRLEIDVDYTADSDPASLLGDVMNTVERAFKERPGVESFRIESVDLI